MTIKEKMTLLLDEYMRICIAIQQLQSECEHTFVAESGTTTGLVYRECEDCGRDLTNYP